MQVFALTEHMPRHEEDFYPEEIVTHTFESYMQSHGEYFAEAIRLRDKYNSQISVPIGFETEWIRPSSMELIEHSLKNYNFDFCVGSVHHVHTKAIDYQLDDYAKARTIAGGTDERLFEDYFDAQYGMLQALKPPVVGHFDLIRLNSDDPDGSFQPYSGVWMRILRNLDFVASYGGILELNTSALRKGMTEPYPKAEICQAGESHFVTLWLLTLQRQAFLEREGRFCLSDDSHGVEQVATNYHRLLPFLKLVGIKILHFLGHAADRSAPPHDQRFPSLVIGSIEIEELRHHSVWTVDSKHLGT